MEQEAAMELKKLGVSSAWGCKDGVFIDSADAFAIVRLLKEKKNENSKGFFKNSKLSTPSN